MSGLCEHWTLPDGRTFKVTALPQPEGATALLFEDITGQVTRNRRFRGTVELQQILLDQRDEAIAVFAPDGTLALCNDAYEQLWQTDHGGSLEAVRLKDSLATWKAGCVPSPEWDSFPQAAAMAHGGWQAQLVMLDGRALFVQASALPGGHLSVEFRNSARGLKPDHPPPHRLQLLA